MEQSLVDAAFVTSHLLPVVVLTLRLWPPCFKRTLCCAILDAMDSFRIILLDADWVETSLVLDDGRE